MNPTLSIVIPLLNEDESLHELHTWIKSVMIKNNSRTKFVKDDGSTDSSWSVIESLREVDENVKGIKFRRNYGKSAALNIGF